MCGDSQLFVLTQGLQWPDGVLPEDRYQFAYLPGKTLDTCSFSSLEVTWQPLDDDDDARIKELMSWFYKYFVLRTADNTVCCFEQSVFFVSGASFEKMPGCTWSAQAEVFDIWDQQKAVVCFSLA